MGRGRWVLSQGLGQQGAHPPGGCGGVTPGGRKAGAEGAHAHGEGPFGAGWGAAGVPHQKGEPPQTLPPGILQPGLGVGLGRAQPGCPHGGVGGTRPLTCVRTGAAPPCTASPASPGCSSASGPGTAPMPSASHPGAQPPHPPPTPVPCLTPMRSHWKSRTLVPGGACSCTLMASTES